MTSQLLAINPYKIKTMQDIYYDLQTRIYKFCETDLSKLESEKEYNSIVTELTKPENSECLEDDQNHFFLMIDYHTKRHIKHITFKSFMLQELPSPSIRIGIVPVNFKKEDYNYMKKLANNTKKTIQELADFMWWNKYSVTRSVNFKTGEIIELSTRNPEGTFNFNKLPPITKLKQLNIMSISHVTDEVVDFNTISNSSLSLEKLEISSLNKVKKIVIIGAIEECKFDFIENLDILDLTGVDLVNSYLFKASFSKNNGECIITDLQKNYPSTFSKFKWKKEIVSSSSEEIERYVASYNWDNGIKFLKWAVKHPLCDKGTALDTYWLGNPAWFTQFKTKKETESWSQDNYALLTIIEKRIKKNDFKTNEFKFNINVFLKDKPIKYPENKIKEIPTYMFINDTNH